jgi:hypothetical protein
MSPYTMQHERGVPGQRLLTAQDPGDVFAVLLPLEGNLSLVVYHEVEVHLVKAGAEVVLERQDPFPRGPVASPGDVAVRQQGHQGAPGRLREPASIVVIPGVVTRIRPWAAHYFSPARIVTGS